MDRIMISRLGRVCLGQRRARYLFAAFLLVVVVLPVPSSSADNAGNDVRDERQAGAGPKVFQSPYDDIDWQQAEQHKIDSHAHARRGLDVADVIELYAQLGYGALSFKDNELHYPIDNYFDAGDEPDITLLPGQATRVYRDEPPYEQHLKIWFVEHDYANSLSFRETFEQVGQENGLIVFAHPASGIYPHYGVNVGADWFIDFFDNYPHVLGIEVTNHDVDNSLKLFDELLAHYGASRLVVALGASDLWGLRDDGRLAGAAGNFGLSIVISEGRGKQDLRPAIERGRVFWVKTPEPHPDDGRVDYPAVRSVRVFPRRIVVDVASSRNEVTWITNNKVIHVGRTLTMRQLEVALPDDSYPEYVRFEVEDDEGGRLGSQAFYIVDQ